MCDSRHSTVSRFIASCVRIPGKTSGGVHGVSEATTRDATADHGVLRAPVPGQVLRRGTNPGRAEREAAGRRHQLQLSLTRRLRALLRQRRFKLRVRRCDQITLRSLPTW